ncbi:hypothetical protein EXN66_Car019498 [Channa argus]|uniref:Uncharacterized protein n=1 Tax=Channa argus TaxID=215402 RepID=A0A6G1QM75_CHAAH|nr:hypothetical protein EXN66_Car019498 [Channa argus]
MESDVGRERGTPSLEGLDRGDELRVFPRDPDSDGVDLRGACQHTPELAGTCKVDPHSIRGAVSCVVH